MAKVERPARTSAYERGGFLPVVRRWWWLLALSALVAGAIGYIVSSRSDPTYESRVQLVVGPINTDLDTQRAAGQLAQLYTELAVSRPVLESTIEQLGLTMTPAELKALTTATADQVARVLTIRTRTASPTLSASIANSLADNLTQLVGRDVRPEGELSIFDPAQPGGKIDVDTKFVIALAAVASLLGTFALVLLGEFLRNSVKDEEELADIAQTRSLGVFDGTSRGQLVVQTRPDSSAASFYRRLAAEIEFLDQERPPRSLIVLGVTGGEGAGEIAANLAAIFVAAGRSVVIVDANQDESEVTALFDLDQRVGVNDLLARPGLLEGKEGFWRSPRPHALAPDVVPIGTTDAVDSVEPEHVEKLLARLLDRHDLVIVNADPLRRSPRTLTWARAVDATVLVGLENRVKREQVVDAAESLRLVGATLVGTILCRGRGIASDLRGGRRRKSAPAPAQTAVDSDGQQPEHTAPTSIRRKGDAPRASNLPTTSESRSGGGAP